MLSHTQDIELNKHIWQPYLKYQTHSYTYQNLLPN